MPYGLFLLAAHPILLVYNDLTSSHALSYTVQTLRGILQPHASLPAYFTVRSACLLAFLRACIFYSFIFPASWPTSSFIFIFLHPGRHTSQLSLPTSRPANSQSSLPTSSQSSLPASPPYSSYDFCLLPACPFLIIFSPPSPPPRLFPIISACLSALLFFLSLSSLPASQLVSSPVISAGPSLPLPNHLCLPPACLFLVISSCLPASLFLVISSCLPASLFPVIFAFLPTFLFPVSSAFLQPASYLSISACLFPVNLCLPIPCQSLPAYSLSISACLFPFNLCLPIACQSLPANSLSISACLFPVNLCLPSSLPLPVNLCLSIPCQSLSAFQPSSSCQSMPASQPASSLSISACLFPVNLCLPIPCQSPAFQPSSSLSIYACLPTCLFPAFSVCLQICWPFFNSSCKSAFLDD
jgi:hypothetical protein